jgi:hypothetical protein
MQNDVNERMNWFERHLNWTAVTALFGSAILYFILMNVSTGWYTILPLISRYRVPILDVAMTVLSYGYFFLNVFICAWILSKKKRGIFNLLFFLPALAFTYMGIFPWWRAENPNTQILIQWFGYAIMFIGWIEVISFKNRDTRLETTTLKSNLTLNINDKTCKICVITLTAIMAFISLSSFVYMRIGTYTYRYDPVMFGDEIPAFSFEHPKSFYISPEFWDFFFDDTTLLVDGTRYSGFVWEDEDNISIWVYDFNSINGTRRSLEDEILSHGFLLYEINGPPYKLDDKTTNAPLLGTTIAGRPGFYLTVTRERNYVYDTDRLTKWMYFFEDSDFLWVISLTEYGHIANNPPSYFTHLLETFKIYDE